MSLIKSYLIYTQNGKAGKVSSRLNDLSGQEATPSESHDVVILVTESPDKETEQRRTDLIKKDEDILSMTLVSAFS